MEESLLVAGKLNKQIVMELGVSELTVNARRAAVMEKMRVTSLAELVRVADQLQAGAPPREDRAFGKRRSYMSICTKATGSSLKSNSADTSSLQSSSVRQVAVFWSTIVWCIHTGCIRPMEYTHFPVLY
jgi:hypothetical protein